MRYFGRLLLALPLTVMACGDNTPNYSCEKNGTRTTVYAGTAGRFFAFSDNDGDGKVDKKVEMSTFGGKPASIEVHTFSEREKIETLDYKKAEKTVLPRGSVIAINAQRDFDDGVKYCGEAK